MLKLTDPPLQPKTNLNMVKNPFKLGQTNNPLAIITNQPLTNVLNDNKSIPNKRWYILKSLKTISL